MLKYSRKAFSINNLLQDLKNNWSSLGSKLQLTRFNGINLDLTDKTIYSNDSNFITLEKDLKLLNDSIDKYNLMQDKSKPVITSINIILPGHLGKYLPIFLKNDINIHSTTKNNLLLNKWVDPFRKNKIPPQPFTNIGVGVAIINDNLDFLMIKEKTGLDQWKFVTGLIDHNETIIEASYREVKEEINLNNSDITILGNIYHRIIGPFGPNELMDICFFNIAKYKHKSFQIDKIKSEMCLDELKDAKIFSYDEIKNMFLNDSNKLTISTVSVLELIFEIVKDKNKNTLNDLDPYLANSTEIQAKLGLYKDGLSIIKKKYFH